MSGATGRAYILATVRAKEYAVSAASMQTRLVLPYGALTVGSGMTSHRGGMMWPEALWEWIVFLVLAVVGATGMMLVLAAVIKWSLSFLF